MKKAVAPHGTGVGAGFKPAPTARYGGTVHFHSKDEEGALQAIFIVMTLGGQSIYLVDDHQGEEVM